MVSDVSVNEVVMSGRETVQRFLEDLQLSQYTAAFLENGYDTSKKCSRLTDSELDSIGVSLIGHRKRILMSCRATSEAECAMVENDQELYDVLPSPKPISQPMTVPEAEYTNLRELDLIPPPMLPPKTKNYNINDFEKFGIIKEVKGADKASTSMKTPIPVPRKFIPHADTKPELPPLRFTKSIDIVESNIQLPDLICSSAPVLASINGSDRLNSTPSVSELTNMWNRVSRCALVTPANKPFAKPSIAEKPHVPIKSPVSATPVAPKPVYDSLNLISFDVYGKSANWTLVPDTVDNGRTLYDTVDHSAEPPRSTESPVSESGSTVGSSIYDEIMCDNDKDTLNDSWPTTFSTTASITPFSNDLVTSGNDRASSDAAKIRELFYSTEKSENTNGFEAIYEDELFPPAGASGGHELVSQACNWNKMLNSHGKANESLSTRQMTNERPPALPLKTHPAMNPNVDYRFLNAPPPVPDRVNVPPPVPSRTNSTLSPQAYSLDSSMSSPSPRLDRCEKLEECDDYVFQNGEDGFRGDLSFDKKPGTRASSASATIPYQLRRHTDFFASFDCKQNYNNIFI